MTSLNRSSDTEITLGTGKMLALFFGLVILCAIFFGMGFSMGRNSVKAAPELLPSPSGSTAPRPSASPTKSSPPETKPQAAAAEAASAAPAPSAGESPAATPPPLSGPGFFVQVAAVSKQEDAEALVESLKNRQYAAFIAEPSPDRLFHVQIGPFADVKDAEGVRGKLVSDGYNPILKK